jgi:hypothetical protein
MQDDYMKRVRDSGRAQEALQACSGPPLRAWVAVFDEHHQY